MDLTNSPFNMLQAFFRSMNAKSILNKLMIKRDAGLDQFLGDSSTIFFFGDGHLCHPAYSPLKLCLIVELYISL